MSPALLICSMLLSVALGAALTLLAQFCVAARARAAAKVRAAEQARREAAQRMYNEASAYQVYLEAASTVGTEESLDEDEQTMREHLHEDLRKAKAANEQAWLRFRFPDAPTL